MTRVLLTIVFFLVATPSGLLQRLFAKRVIEDAFKLMRPVIGNYERTVPRRPITRNNSRMGGKLSILSEFWSFLRAPVVILLLTLGLILAVTEGSTLAPFIYSLF